MSRVISIKQIKEKNFHTLTLEEPWASKFGNPERSFKMMIYGPSGSGKSTMTMKLWDYLAHNFGKVLYNSWEEGIAQTLKDRIISTGVSSPNLMFADRMSFGEMIEKLKKGRYHFAVIDSVNYMKFSYSDYKEYEKQVPSKGLILINQVNGQGKIKGGTDILHATDIKINVVKGLAMIESRYAASNTQMRLFGHEPKTLFSQ